MSENQKIKDEIENIDLLMKEEIEKHKLIMAELKLKKIKKKKLFNSKDSNRRKKNPRDLEFKFRLSADEMENLIKNAKRFKIKSISEFVRLSCCTVNDRRTALMKIEIESLIRQLKTVGRNVNRARFYLDNGGFVEKSNFLKKDFVDKYDETLNTINEYFKK